MNTATREAYGRALAELIVEKRISWCWMRI